MKDEIPDPTVATAQEIAEKFQKDVAIVITLNSAGRLTVNSYGKDKATCAAAGRMAEGCFTLIMNQWKAAAEKLKEQTPAKVKLFSPRIIKPNGS